MVKDQDRERQIRAEITAAMTSALLDLEDRINQVVPTRPQSEGETTHDACPSCSQRTLARVEYRTEADQPMTALVVCRANCGYRELEIQQESSS